MTYGSTRKESSSLLTIKQPQKTARYRLMQSGKTDISARWKCTSGSFERTAFGFHRPGTLSIAMVKPIARRSMQNLNLPSHSFRISGTMRGWNQRFLISKKYLGGFYHFRTNSVITVVIVRR